MKTCVGCCCISVISLHFTRLNLAELLAGAGVALSTDACRIARRRVADLPVSQSWSFQWLPVSSAAYIRLDHRIHGADRNANT